MKVRRALLALIMMILAFVVVQTTEGATKRRPLSKARQAAITARDNAGREYQRRMKRLEADAKAGREIMAGTYKDPNADKVSLEAVSRAVVLSDPLTRPSMFASPELFGAGAVVCLCVSGLIIGVAHKFRHTEELPPGLLNSDREIEEEPVCDPVVEESGRPTTIMGLSRTVFEHSAQETLTPVRSTVLPTPEPVQQQPPIRVYVPAPLPGSTRPQRVRTSVQKTPRPARCARFGEGVAPAAKPARRKRRQPDTRLEEIPAVVHNAEPLPALVPEPAPVLEAITAEPMLVSVATEPVVEAIAVEPLVEVVAVESVPTVDESAPPFEWTDGVPHVEQATTQEVAAPSDDEPVALETVPQDFIEAISLEGADDPWGFATNPPSVTHINQVTH